MWLLSTAEQHRCDGQSERQLSSSGTCRVIRGTESRIDESRRQESLGGGKDRVAGRHSRARKTAGRGRSLVHRANICESKCSTNHLHIEYTAYSSLVFTKVVRESDQTNSISIVMCRISTTGYTETAMLRYRLRRSIRARCRSLVEIEDSTSVLIVHPYVCAQYTAMSGIDFALEDKAHCPSKAQLSNEDTSFRHSAQRSSLF